MEENENEKPRSYQEAMMAAAVTKADRDALEGPDEPAEGEGPSLALDPPVGTPPWALVPSDLAMPQGKEVGFVMFRAEWTDFPKKGDRQCIIWSLTDNDEKNSIKRARGDRERAVSELAKGTIRAIDGRRVDWSGKEGGGVDPNRFWNEIGPKCRQLLITSYLKTHALDAKEQDDFFTNCFVFKRPT